MSAFRLGVTLVLLGGLLCLPLSAQKSKVDNPRPTPPFDPEFRLPQPTLNFLVLGDWGSGSKGQKLVARVMARKYEADGAAAVLGTGDNFYPSGVEGVEDPLWYARFESVYPAADLPIPFHATLGNHDYIKNPDAQVAYTGSLLDDGTTTRWIMPARYWTTTFTGGQDLVIRVVGLDTPMLVGTDQDARTRQLKWLDSVLAADASPVVLVLGHHPVFSNGVHGNTLGLIRNLKPILEKHQVDAYIAGHDHDLQILTAVNGVQYLVSGGGGLSRDVRYATNTVFAATNMGVVWLQVNATKMLVHVLDATGELLYAVTLPLNPKK